MQGREERDRTVGAGFTPTTRANMSIKVVKGTVSAEIWISLIRFKTQFLDKTSSALKKCYVNEVPSPLAWLDKSKGRRYPRPKDWTVAEEHFTK